MNEESIFAAALTKQSATERAAYLDAACAGDAGLRAQVDDLLRASDDAGSFLNHAPVSAGGTDATIAATRADGDTEKSADWTGQLPFLQPCDAPGRIGKLGHYEIVEVVGRGGMGAVLRAFDTKLSRVVAVKVMAPELAANPTAVKRFLREAKMAAAVHHDHVVTIHEIQEEHRPPYLVMQFIEGQTLAQKIEREGALALSQILCIGSQIAAGLAAAHKHGLVHRDVKPANILLENGVERVKITDFGLARAADDVEVTQAGMIAGTPQYMSPEQAKGETIDMRSDLFSLGSVLYTMCTGRAAFRAETTMGVLKRVCEDAPRPIHEVNPEMPDWLEAIVLKLLAKNPADRFQSASDVSELLAQHLAHVQSPTLVARPATVVIPASLTPPFKQLIQPVAIAPAHQPTSGAGVALVVILGLLLLVIAPVVLIAVGLAIPWTMMKRSAPRQNIVDYGTTGEPALTVQAAVEMAQLPPMDLNQWGKLLDPTGNCTVERRSDMAIFHVPGDVPYNLIPGLPLGMNAPRMLREARGDFAIQIRVLPFGKALPATSTAGPDTASWRSAGLVVLGGEETVIRLERVSWGERIGGAPMMHFECFHKGQRIADHYGTITDDERSTLFRLERRGDVILGSYSDDGSRWDTYRLDQPALPEQVLVGLAAVQTTPTTFDPAFEALRFRSGPDSVAGSLQESLFGDWTALFNGQDLTGWYEHPAGEGAWTIEDKVLVGRGTNHYLYTTRGNYGDFRLRAEVKISASGDSGILVRMAPPEEPPLAQRGYEVQITGDANHVSPTASIIRHGTAMKDRGVQGRGDLIQPDQWFLLEIAVIGGQLTVSIDGQEVASLRDNVSRTSGHIALQSISDATEVSFRKIEISEPLSAGAPAQPLVTAETLAAAPRIPGWGASWSPDGRRLVRNRRSSDELEIIDLASRQTKVLYQGGADPAWSPVAGGPIAFVRGTERNDVLKEELWLIEADGTNPRKLCDGGYPSWSRDGTRLYYRHASGTLRQVRSLDPAKPEAPPTVYALAPDASSYPTVSPDGTMVAHGIGTRLVVHTLNDSKQVASVIVPQWSGILPCWSPDSRYVTYGSFGWNDNRGAWILDTQTGQSRMLAAGSLTLPRWSPDGSRIAIDERSTSEIAILNLADLHLEDGLPQANAGARLPPSTAESAEVKALREAIAAKEKNLQVVQAQFGEGRVPPLIIKTAQAEVIEAHIRLAEAECDRAAVVTRLRELVANIKEEQELVQKRIDAGVDAITAASAVAARLAEAQARLAKAEAASPPPATPPAIE
jgi:hypothetical protein